MKTSRSFRFYLILMVFIVANVNCANAGINSSLQNKEERKLPAFSELNLAICADVILTQGSVQKVEIVASEKQLKQIETEVKNGALLIKWTNNFVTSTGDIKIYITMTEVNGIRISGSGDIWAKGPITSKDLDLSISGSGDLKLENLSAENIKSSISGSADIFLGGNQPATSLDVSISGSGDFNAEELPFKNVEVGLSGSGNCRVNATEGLKARISGSGDVYYKGSATIDARVSGSGSVQHIN